MATGRMGHDDREGLMLKKMIIGILLSTVLGCASVPIPAYLPDRKPFYHRYYATHADVKAAVTQVLMDRGWILRLETSPQVYELDLKRARMEKEVLLMAEIQRSRMFFAHSQESINFYIYSTGNVSDVEMRYLAVNYRMGLTTKSYGQLRMAQQFFQWIEQELSGEGADRHCAACQQESSRAKR